MDHASIGDWEPFNTVSHALGAALAAVGGAWLWVRCRGARRRQVILTLYSLSMAVCFGASALFHGIRRDPETFRLLLLLDRICIYSFIAGTITPLAAFALRGRWRAIGLIWAWGSALAGTITIARYGDVAPILATGLYLLMGWCALALLVKASRVLPKRATWTIVVGGTIYSAGAATDLLWGGHGGHEIFHVFVLLGAACHFVVMAGCFATDDPVSASRFDLPHVVPPPIKTEEDHEFTRTNTDKELDSVYVSSV